MNGIPVCSIAPDLHLPISSPQSPSPDLHLLISIYRLIDPDGFGRVV